MFAASIPYVEVGAGRDLHLPQAMGGLVAVVFVVAFIVVFFGPEAKGVSSESTHGARGSRLGCAPARKLSP